jgi:hypothetical protein
MVHTKLIMDILNKECIENKDIEFKDLKNKHDPFCTLKLILGYCKDNSIFYVCKRIASLKVNLRKHQFYEILTDNDGKNEKYRINENKDISRA